MILKKKILLFKIIKKIKLSFSSQFVLIYNYYIIIFNVYLFRKENTSYGLNVNTMEKKGN
jgi:hypothetical protein